jgi:hypothetical protein
LGVDKTVLFECFIIALLLLFPPIVVDDAVVLLFEGANENVGGWVVALVTLFVGANENNVLAGVGGAATVLVVAADDDDDVNENVGLDVGAMDAAAAAEDCAAKEMLANGFGLAGGSSCGADVDVAAGGARLANKKGFDEGVDATDVAPAATADPADPAPAPLSKPNDLRETLIILRR